MYVGCAKYGNSSSTKYSERDPSNVLPDTRSILAGAFGEVAKTSEEKQKAAQYRANIGQAALS